MRTQGAADFAYWKGLYSADRAAYKAEKLKLAADWQARLVGRYPELAGKIEFLDITTPVTYERYCGAYKGSYMSFMLTPGTAFKIIKGRIKGLKNCFAAGQWLQPPGGLPGAAATAKFAVQRICKRERIKL
jgi:phytoene dehydrogenase-like protein